MDPKQILKPNLEGANLKKRVSVGSLLVAPVDLKTQNEKRNSDLSQVLISTMSKTRTSNVPKEDVPDLWWY